MRNVVNIVVLAFQSRSVLGRIFAEANVEEASWLHHGMRSKDAVGRTPRKNRVENQTRGNRIDRQGHSDQ